MYERIKNNHYQECTSATKEYQSFINTITVYYGDYMYHIVQTSFERQYVSNKEDDYVLTIAKKNRYDDNAEREDMYSYKYHNCLVDWIDLATNAIEDDYPHTETESDDVF